MNYNNIIFYDFETGSRSPHRTQPVQLAAVAIDGRRMEVIEGSVFQSYIRPVFDEKECDKYDLDPLTDEALEVNKIQKDTLREAPSLKEVWNQFVSYVGKYNTKKGRWGAPIKAGYNNTKFDDVIIDRICGGHLRYMPKVNKKLVKGLEKELKYVEGDREAIPDAIEFLEQFKEEPYKFGPWDDERGEETLFMPRDTIDVMRVFIWPWTENMEEIRNISMDAVREWLGLSTEGAHDAVVDVTQGAELLTRFLRLHRQMAIKTKWRRNENQAVGSA